MESTEGMSPAPNLVTESERKDSRVGLIRIATVKNAPIRRRFAKFPDCTGNAQLIRNAIKFQINLPLLYFKGTALRLHLQLMLEVNISALKLLKRK